MQVRARASHTPHARPIKKGRVNLERGELGVNPIR